MRCYWEAVARLVDVDEVQLASCLGHREVFVPFIGEGVTGERPLNRVD